MVDKSEESTRVRKFKVLSDESRLQVLELLAGRPLSVNEITDVLDIPQSLLSHHLRILRDVGFVKCERDGQRKVYKISENLKVDQQIFDFGCCFVKLQPPDENT